MFSNAELADIRATELGLLADIEQLCQCKGSYNYVCWCGGGLTLTHRPVGRVIRAL